MANGRKTDVQRITAAERRQQVLDLRKVGVTFRGIGRQLAISEAQAHRDYTAAMARCAALEASSAEELRQLELLRLDTYLLALAPSIRLGKVDAIGEARRISESRRKLLGLDLQTGNLLPTDMEIILRWHDGRDIIDITPQTRDNPAAALPAPGADSSAPGEVSYHCRWEEMGQEPAGGDAQSQDRAE